MTDLAHYYFVPTVREGLAAYISGPATSARAQIEAQLTPISDAVRETPVGKTVSLFGPGDVLGFDSAVVSRVDPRLNVWDFEPNYMPLIEFSEPDLPWRFTPDAFDVAAGYLRPWLTLIVLRAEDYKGLGEKLPAEDDANAVPIRWIEDVFVNALPDLDEAWKWAHVQVTAEHIEAPTTDELKAELAGRVSGEGEDHVVARLICPRQLSPSTKYTAFVVPTFKSGRVAAGLDVEASGDTALTLGWTKRGASATEVVDLPYYYKWDFATSVRGDFEYLVRLLEPRPLTTLGTRPMACVTSGYVETPCPGAMANDGPLQLEGALMSVDLHPGSWAGSTDVDVALFQTELAGVINGPGELAAAPAADTSATDVPRVVPPVYGRWHSGSPSVDARQTSNWKDEVNLDPRLRAAAGFGALVVQKEQEALMASMWDQLGDIDMANQIMRNGLLGLRASTGLFNRLGKLGLPAFLWVAAPVFDRVRAQLPGSATPSTVAQLLKSSPIPMAALEPAFRRLQRPRGGIRKHQRRVHSLPNGWDLLSRLNVRDVAAAGPPPALAGMPSLCKVTDAALLTLHRDAAPTRATAGAYRINGRVIYETTRHPVPRVRVEAWDKDPFFSDLLGGAITDEAGGFRIDFDESYFREWFLDRRPDVTFKVFRGPKLIRLVRPGVLRNIAAGDRDVVVEVAEEGDSPPAPSIGDARIYDFCEAAITPAAVVEATAARTDFSQLHHDTALSIARALEQWLMVTDPSPDPAQAVDLQAIADTVAEAVTPSKTIPARLSKRVRLGPGTHQRGPLARIESEVDFPQPMYEPLAAISQDLVLPGVETVPQNTISILKTNRRFIEGYMLGLNDSISAEALWRGAPYYLWTTAVRQFWQVEGLVDEKASDHDPELSKDITRLARWSAASPLGSHDPRGMPTDERAVLLVRGDVLKRYPNTLVYAVPTLVTGDPALDEYSDGSDAGRLWPIFSGSLPPDLTFLGFDTTATTLCRGGPGDRGYFIVLEERLGEPRFGFDDVDGPPPPLSGATWWYDMAWSHFQPGVGRDSYIDGAVPSSAADLVPSWGTPGTSAATVANICLQRPVRVAVHASQMLSAVVCPP